MVSIKLDVIDENPDAKRLYEKIGFKPIKKIVQKAIKTLNVINIENSQTLKLILGKNTIYLFITLSKKS